MSSARFFTCLIISNLKKTKEIKRVKVRMHLNLHKELCRLDGEVLNLDLDAVFRFFCKMLMCRETLHWEGGNNIFGNGNGLRIWKALAFAFLQIPEIDVRSKKIFLWENTVLYTSCSVQSDPIIHSPLQKEPETFDSGMFDRNYNNIQQQHNGIPHPTCVWLRTLS